MRKKVIPKLWIGQVVLIDVEFYTDNKSRDGRVHGFERYQKIKKITNWAKDPKAGKCLTFLNGDRCHEKYVRTLTLREVGPLR